MGKETNLSKLLEIVCVEMERLGYAEVTIKEFRSYCRRYGRFVEGLEKPDVFSEELAAEFLKKRYNYPPKDMEPKMTSTIYSAVHAMRRLGEFQLYGSFTGVWKRTRAGFAWACDDEKHIKNYLNEILTADSSKSTEDGHIYAIKNFYKFLDVKKISSVTDSDPQLLSDFVLSLQGRSRSSIQLILGKLRRYLQYLFDSGVIVKDISVAIPKVSRVGKSSKLPLLWDKKEIERLLNSIDRTGSVGKRDYAVLLMISQLGIRVSDVSGLRLEHLKWESKQICFSQQKTKETVYLPLVENLGWAIIDYIKHARPKSESPHLFLICNAPYRALTPSAITAILYKHMRRCGIKRDKDFNCGAHALRHAMARRLSEQGAPLSTISNIMGHTSLGSASPYLKVDIEGMRQCALSLGGV